MRTAGNGETGAIRCACRFLPVSRERVAA
jgi:hypothetical protein